MKRKIQLFVVLLLSVLIAGAKSKSLPNVVFIYGDDVGYGDVGVYGSVMIPTPNIDRLASEGIRFTDGHCTAATCTPSRYALLTGENAFRKNLSVLPPGAPLSISTEAFTLPKLFKQAGYHTGMIGKWHLGLGTAGVETNYNADVKPGPLEVGFDYSFILPSTNDRVPCVYLRDHRVVGLDSNDLLYIGKTLSSVQKPGSMQYPDGKTNPEAMTYYRNTGNGHNQTVINGIGRIGYQSGGKSALWNDETMADEFVKEAQKYIALHKDEPFFLHFCAQDIHVPRAPNPRFQGTTKLGYRGDAMVEFDWATGEILKALEKYGLTENTIVVFSSDNGPVYDDGYDDGTVKRTEGVESDRGHDASGIYRGGKYDIHEGGTRVPFIIRWPAKIKPGVSHALVNQIDLFASFAALLNIELPEGQARDSRNTLDAFLGKDKKGLPFMLEEAKSARALREGDWKYIGGFNRKTKQKLAELYNLKDDPGEQHNLISKYPEKAKQMAKRLEELLNSESIR